ncbi:orotate phosphoribosyltransferase, partial [Clostridium perfringens]|nr:orotate phosphoribosyltransferase [Clostridium perfringens]
VTYPIVTMKEVVNYLYNREVNGKIHIDDNMKNAIEDYYKKYGVNYNN